MAMLFHSTRGKNVNVTAKQAIRKGIADDGGLFVTDSLGEKTVDVANLTPDNIIDSKPDRPAFLHIRSADYQLLP